MKPSEESFYELKDIYDENEKEDALVDLLNRLPADKRNVFIMYIRYGNNYTALARHLHCSPAWMRSYIMSIREEIKKMMK